MKNDRFQNRLDISSSSQRPNATGMLLVASPLLAGTPFERTAVFVVQDNENGTFGVTLNRPMEGEHWERFRDLFGVKSAARDTVLAGGPVAGPVLALHRDPELAEINIGDQVFVSVQAEAIDRLMQRSDGPYRIALGMLAWNPGQLNDEIQAGLWFPVEATVEDVFGDPQRVWIDGVKRYGRRQMQRITGISHFPEDPMMN